MAKIKPIFECEACGNQQAKWMGKCPQCGAWESFIELKPSQIKALNEIKNGITAPGAAFSRAGDTALSATSTATPITQIKIEQVSRRTSGDAELDLVLGGGVVEGSLVLIGGAPGIGKSTLLLKIGANLAKNGEKILYVSGEESATQIKLRAERLNATHENLFLLTEINLATIIEEIAAAAKSASIEASSDSAKNSDSGAAKTTASDSAKTGYKTIIIDSIQTLYSDKITSAPGSISQVREITFELMRLAKSLNITIFIIGHITKEGSIAGPRILEHMVDVVLYFEGDASRELRILRGIKNRFGATSEVGIFEMSDGGLISAKDAASRFFTRGEPVSGSAITATTEGSRVLIVEIQALVCESGYPKRSSTGFDRNRLDMILALLERKLEIPLGHYDVFINVTGGVKITETACDLAVVAAIISSFRNRPISKETIFLGELSLNGQIREIPNLDLRLKEATTQKFKNAITPQKPLTKTPLKIYEAKQITQVIEWM